MPASEILLTIQTNTKEEEKEIVIQFLTRFQYVASSLISSECPDFEIQITDKLIGVEVTKYYSDFDRHGSVAQQTISEWKKFAETLKKRLVEIDAGFQFLYGAIHFHSDSHKYKELLKKDTLKELILLLKSNKLADQEQKTLSINPDLYPNLNRRIESIFLYNTFPENKYLWWDGSLQSGKVIKNDNAVQSIINKKEIAARKYKGGYFQKWLIIYAGGIGLHDIYANTSGEIYRQGRVTLTQIADVSPIEHKTLASEYFSHIFIWDKYTENIYLLYPYFKKLFDWDKKTIYVNYLPLANL